ncbi:aldehyde dehydrogenase family protein [Arthrobacter sp. SDTb3-6]|uniref:aldehyde dehydrogenase family protein n=1 Tax=Arthrobacter sp. SDTb3-6 TaxID=2713571 RepID=UPI00159E5329|nr:aldehyde dehydrogenase family protein [Arthrobacter sp. SDTb3-6]
MPKLLHLHPRYFTRAHLCHAHPGRQCQREHWCGHGREHAFGGFKQSGWGHENGREGIEAYTSLKSVTVKLH